MDHLFKFFVKKFTEMEAMDLSLIIVLALSALSIFGFVSLSKDNDEKIEAKSKIEELLSVNNFVVVKKSTSSIIKGIGIDRDNIIIFDNGSILKIHNTELISVEIVTDDTTINKISRTSQISGGLAGAVIAGPVGAIIGAMGATSKTTKAPPLEVKLRILYENLENPLFELDFIEFTSTGKTEGLTALKEAENWFARVKALIHNS